MQQSIGDFVSMSTWHRSQYQINLGGSSYAQVDGIALGAFGIHQDSCAPPHVTVTHIASGLRLANVDTLGAAFELIERVQPMRDWSNTAFTPEETKAITEVISYVRTTAERPRNISSLSKP